MALVHLIYVSTAITLYDDVELDKMLESAVRHNAPQQVTGMLLYGDGNFMQVIEGEGAAIDETYGRIVKDPRHKHILLLEHGPTEGRQFSQWNMGFRRLDRSDTATHPAYVDFFANGFDSAQLAKHYRGAMTMLKEFGASQR